MSRLDDAIAALNTASLEAAILLLNTAERSELRDHAFGDCEVCWWADGPVKVASGYFGAERRSVTIRGSEPVTFTGDDADRLRECGRLVAIERNDSTGPDTYHEGDIMPGLTREGVLYEICDPEEER